MPACKLSVIVPAYNEGDCIRANLREICAAAQTLTPDYEIIAVNDGSGDETWPEILRASADNDRVIPLNLAANCGKGYALYTGTEKATGALIAFCDADLDIHPRQLAGFVNLMRSTGADAVIGSKLHRDSKVDYPLIRKLYSFAYYLFLRVLFRLDTRDTQTGLKLFKADVLKPVMRQILVKRFAFDIEVLAIIRRRGYRIVSAPVEIVFHKAAFGRIGIQDILNIFIDSLAVFYRMYILHYYDRQNSEAAKEDDPA